MRASRSIRTWLGGAAWTGLLVAGLLFLDRRVIAPPPEAEAWRRVTISAGELPYLPAYLPATLAWPPVEIWRRQGDRPGQWLGVIDEGGETPRLWIGWGEGTLPPPMAPLAGCRREQADCPAGWRFLSTTPGDSTETGQEVQLLSDLGAEETRRILVGLMPTRDRELP